MNSANHLMASTPARDVLQQGAEENAVFRKVTARLMPFLLVAYILAYLDRINVGFAKLYMLNDLQFSDAIYGLGAGLFFIGYFFFEVPSNLLMHRIGARLTISRIMILWGIISGGMMFVQTPMQFYVMRFLLGVAEAGFYPGILLYLTYWYPSNRRAKAVALFMLAIPLSGVFGGPLSGWLMDGLNGYHGLKGWQWMFLVEATPSVIVGILTLYYLDDRVAGAKWLNDDEKQLIERVLAEDKSAITEHSSVSSVFADPRVLKLSLICFCMLLGQYALTFWLPSLIKQSGVKTALDVGLLTAIPFGVAAVSMVALSRSSDRRGERRIHLAGALAVGAIGLLFSAMFESETSIAIIALAVAAGGILAAAPIFWAIPSAILKGASSAAGLAFICSIGNLAGFISPYMIGWVKDATHSTSAALYLLAAMLLVGAASTLRVSRYSA
ncbi:MFS transporter [Cupriavidus pauculus]|uniref:MFS transporter n=1 Tax=Cupriavidus pauculus TaxID=82633 RepID=A0A2N5C3F8_9BURK|nr:MFS transporter [Cupriavidus pauculus]